MGFEDKKEKLSQAFKNTKVEPSTKLDTKKPNKVVKSYTIDPDLAEELKKRAKNDKRTASNYLEQILEKAFQ